MKFHLAHIVTSHGMHGYKEVIETVGWGLQKLGHTVTYGLNRAANDSRNIIFGAQVLNTASQSALPPDSIVYNFEQLRNFQLRNVRQEVHEFARRFEIWEYSPYNLDFWHVLKPAHPVKLVPVGYAPVLERIPKPAEQDIDVLIYGLPNAFRMQAFEALAHKGLVCVFVSGLYGKARDDLIARSKLILNLSLYTHSQIFEIVRVSYLLANRKAVVSVVMPETAIEPDMLPAIVASTPKTMIADVEALVQDAQARSEVEARGYVTMKQRNITEYLAKVLQRP